MLSERERVGFFDAERVPEQVFGKCINRVFRLVSAKLSQTVSKDFGHIVVQVVANRLRLSVKDLPVLLFVLINALLDSEILLNFQDFFEALFLKCLLLNFDLFQLDGTLVLYATFYLLFLIVGHVIERPFVLKKSQT